jgi:hypothetical protein
LIDVPIEGRPTIRVVADRQEDELALRAHVRYQLDGIVAAIAALARAA